MNNPQYRIQSIQFSLLSGTELLKYATVEVNKPLTYENGIPVSNGLNDTKMGEISNRRKRCNTCDLKSKVCPGHFGYIALGVAVFNPLFLRGSKMGNKISIENILKCICVRCGKLRINIPNNIYNIPRKHRMTHLLDIIIKKQKVFDCRSKFGCRALQPKKFIIDKTYNRITYNETDILGEDASREGGNIIQLHPEYVECLFKHIDDDTVRSFGMDPNFARPEWLIIKYLPVIPPATRPVMEQTVKQKSEDDLVTAYMNIIKKNNELLSRKQKDDAKYEDLVKSINMGINILFVGHTQSGGTASTAFSYPNKPLKSIKQRLSGKHGRLRLNLSGKRVDFSGRTVISPDVFISVDEIGIPIEMAKKWSFPVRITQDNIDEMYLYLYNTREKKYPGAHILDRYITNGEYKSIILKYIDTNKIVLQPGDVLHRNLIDGDYVMLNRQPSLHKMSLMAHKIRILPGKTIRLNLAATGPYNADFDGDEMNVHVPQSLKTVIEIKRIASVKEVMITPATSNLIVGIIQDSLVGIFKMTLRGKKEYIKQTRFNNIVMNNHRYNFTSENKQLYSGYDILNTFMPNINYIQKEKLFDDTTKQILRLLSNINDNCLVKGLDSLNYLGIKYINENIITVIDKLLTLTRKKHVEKKGRGKKQNHEKANMITSEENKLLSLIKTNITSKDVVKLKQNIQLLRKYENAKNSPLVDTFNISDRKMNVGVIKKGLVKPGGGDNNLIYMTWNDVGKASAKRFIDNLQTTVISWLIEEGHTIGLGDLMIKDKDVREEIKLEIHKTLENYKKFENKIIQGKFIPGIGRTIEDELEYQSKVLFGDLFDGKLPKIISKVFNPDNNLYLMVNSGSKGSMTNVVQIMGSVSQQIIRGNRTAFAYNGRTLPFFEKYDNSPLARGFIEHSFVDGLNPIEFFFHAGSGREGSIDTAIKTSGCGYLSRKLIKTMEPVKATNQLLVEDDNHNIIQYTYGGVLLNPIYITNIKIPITDYSNEKILNEYRMSNTYLSQFKYTKEQIQIFGRDIRKLFAYRLLLRKYIGAEKFITPFNLDRMILNAKQYIPNVKGTADSLINPLEIIGKVGWVCRLLPKLLRKYDKRFSLKPKNVYNHHDILLNLLKHPNLTHKQIFEHIITNDLDWNLLLITIYIKTMLSPKQLIFKHNISLAQFEWIINRILFKFNRAIINPGEAVGVLAAQSISEPTTQATLNTFHLAGVAAKSQVIMGLPRIMEGLNITKSESMKTPMATIYVTEENRFDQYKVKVIANSIEYATLRNFVVREDIYYDPDIFNTVITEDKAFVDTYIKNTITFNRNMRLSKYLIRFELDKRKIIYKQLRLDFIKLKIDTYRNGILYCIHSDDAADKLVLHIRLNLANITGKTKTEYRYICDIFDIILDDVIIKGINKIKSAQIDDRGNFIKVYDKDTGAVQNRNEWVIYTSGTNLEYIYSIVGVDKMRTISNDIVEVYNIFGIEAARQLLYEQLDEIFQQTNTELNYHHLGLLVDRMAFSGKLMPVNRFGINRTDTSVLTKASFEETIDQLASGAIFSSYDNMNSMTSNIFCGQTIPAGTGYNKLVYNIDG